MAASIAALVKTIMGVGVLTLCQAMGAGTGLAPATLMMLTITLASAYSFALLGHTCGAASIGDTCTFGSLWASTIGKSSSWIVDASISAFTACICTVIFIVLGDLLPPLFSLMQLPSALCSRRSALLFAFFTVMPLCAQKSLANLSFSSYLGMGALLYTAVFLSARYLGNGYREGGRWHDEMPPALRPANGVPTWNISKFTPVLIANLGISTCAHFSAPEFYANLARRTPFRFDLMVYSAYAIVLVLSLVIACAGYFTFGTNSQVLILNNYHETKDGPATAARAATVASIICSFPLAFAALRTAFLGIATRGSSVGDAAWWSTTLAIPTACLAIALSFDDLGLIVGLLGSILGGAIIYVFPAVIHMALLRKTGTMASNRIVLLADIVLLVYGIFIQMGWGTFTTLESHQAR